MVVILKLKLLTSLLNHKNRENEKTNFDFKLYFDYSGFI